MGFLLLHGLGGDRSQPLGLFGPVLPTHDRVYAPDLRAHGTSSQIGGPQQFSFTAITNELEQGLHDEGLTHEPLTVIGISLGAALALQLAGRHSLPIERLILLRPAFTDQPLPPHLAVLPVIGELLLQHGAKQGEALFRTTGIYRRFAGESPLGAAGLIEQFRKPDAPQRAIRLVELPRNSAFAPGAKLTLPPTTIIAAPRDPLHPFTVAELWHRTLSDSTLTALPSRDAGMADYVSATRAAVRAAMEN